MLRLKDVCMYQHVRMLSHTRILCFDGAIFANSTAILTIIEVSFRLFNGFPVVNWY